MQIFKNFKQSSSGNVAIMFAISALPVMLAGGMAIDYMAGSRSQTSLQQAVDNAALAVGSSGEDDIAKLKILATNYLRENGAYNVLDELTEIDVIVGSDDIIHVTAKGNINTRFLGLVGKSKIDIAANADVNRDYGNLEVALVLDNTGSMNDDGKLDSLKGSAKDLVRELHDNLDSASTLKIAIVPFSKYVNVGLENRAKSWIDVPADTTQVVSGTRDIRTAIAGSEHNCGTRTYTTTSDGVTTTHTYEACDYEYEVTGTEDYSDTVEKVWTGCVGSRNHPLNVKDTSPGVRIPGLLNDPGVICPRAITRLTESRSDINLEIDSLVAVGGTYIPAGLMWGWRVLSNAAPFNDAVTNTEMVNKNYTKAIVLMTDGVNTQKPDYPAHSGDGGDATTANNLTAELCTNIKNSGSIRRENLVIYTVTFAVTDPSVKSLLKNCATNDSYYFDAADKVALSEAFTKIGKSLISLRLAK